MPGGNDVEGRADPLRISLCPFNNTVSMNSLKRSMKTAILRQTMTMAVEQ
ncbi:hypothetical protein ACFOUV_07315 [Oceanobacillus longus]|uniref:Uncharacterized protein n=1 Tax=Oceanobacillus longus TaxID=930120 RepID=A0ABV8GUR1_9BACI